jgi:transcriptional regulator with GAF, ATPase, and Fis domain
MMEDSKERETVTMAYRATEWAYLSSFKPNEAKKRILDAHAATKGNRVQAAKRLKLSYMTMVRLVDKLDLSDDISRIRQKFGFSLGRSPLDDLNLSDKEKERKILRALRENNGSQNAAAKSLGISFRMVVRAVKAFGLEDEVKDRKTLIAEGAISFPGRPRKAVKAKKGK